MDTLPIELHFAILEELDFQSLPAAVAVLAHMYFSKKVLDVPQDRLAARRDIYSRHYSTLWVKVMQSHLSASVMNETESKDEAMLRLGQCKAYFDAGKAKKDMTLLKTAQWLHQMAVRLEESHPDAYDDHLAPWIYKRFEMRLLPLAWNWKQKFISAAALGCKALLLALLADIRYLEEKQRSLLLQRALVQAYSYRHAKLAQLLVQEGADLNVRDNVGCTPIYLACINGDLNLTRILMEKGADLKVQIHLGWTALHFACRRGSLNLAQLLIEKGADLNVQQHCGFTELHFACNEGKLALAQLLIGAGADLNVRNDLGDTPLHCAYRNRHFELAKLLIATGADVNLTNHNSETPLQLAYQHGYVVLAGFLLTCHTVEIRSLFNAIKKMGAAWLPAVGVVVLAWCTQMYLAANHASSVGTTPKAKV